MAPFLRVLGVQAGRLSEGGAAFLWGEGDNAAGHEAGGTKGRGRGVGEGE
ncbi:MAG: hypothetical protein LBT14_08660 [Treponema sp.]|nr:hypothetical protein [Treponema sp.]